MQLFFLRYNQMWPVFIPVLGELVLVLYLMGLKLYFDGVDDSGGTLEEGTLITLNGGGDDGEILINDQQEAESGERIFLFRGSSAETLEPLMADESQGHPAEVRREGSTPLEKLN